MALTLALTLAINLGLAEELAAFEPLTKLILFSARNTISVTTATSFAVPTNLVQHITALVASPMHVFHPSLAWRRKPPTLSAMALQLSWIVACGASAGAHADPPIRW